MLWDSCCMMIRKTLEKRVRCLSSPLPLPTKSKIKAPKQKPPDCGSFMYRKPASTSNYWLVQNLCVGILRPLITVHYLADPTIKHLLSDGENSIIKWLCLGFRSIMSWLTLTNKWSPACNAPGRSCHRVTTCKYHSMDHFISIMCNFAMLTRKFIINSQNFMLYE